MSFKCSVFGHAFGDAEIEREREEEGKEVVTTIREMETCERCGETRVVSENKEVTTLETAADIVAEDLETDENGDEPTDSTAAEAGADEKAADAEVIEAEAGTDTATATIPDAETGDDVADDDIEPDPATDDGVILDEAEEQTPTEGRDPGEWPEEPEDEDDDWEPATEPEFEEGGPTIEQTGTAVTVPDGEFQCPECAFTTPVAESSLREGDFCPECHRGSLDHVSE